MISVAIADDNTVIRGSSPYTWIQQGGTGHCPRGPDWSGIHHSFLSLTDFTDASPVTAKEFAKVEALQRSISGLKGETGTIRQARGGVAQTVTQEGPRG